VTVTVSFEPQADPETVLVMVLAAGQVVPETHTPPVGLTKTVLVVVVGFTVVVMMLVKPKTEQALV